VGARARACWVCSRAVEVALEGQREPFRPTSDQMQAKVTARTARAGLMARVYKVIEAAAAG